MLLLRYTLWPCSLFFLPAFEFEHIRSDLFCFCERHSDCGEDPLLGSSANVAKIKLASNNMSSILNAIGLKKAKSEQTSHSFSDRRSENVRKRQLIEGFSQINTVLRAERALENHQIQFHKTHLS